MTSRLVYGFAKRGFQKIMERTMTNEGEEARCPGWIVGLEEEHGGK